ncbi:MAG: L-lactate permease, partial [Nitriliruptoraceae bacterium]|nr:L-lactate permease [Nitriliruptoraceae bacterium]
MSIAAPLWAVAVAVVPVGLLTVLVLRAVAVTRAAWFATALAAVTALTVFGLDPGEVGVAVLRGTWTGTWILAIVLPALLLFEVLDRSGALERLASAADTIAPTEGRRLLLLAFVLPSFLQGAAGFGAPIAMSAPMLVRRGMAPAAAVAACLIGYQWSVTFGSMGSSYFMAEATARLTGAQAAEFAWRAAVVLAVTAVVSGLLVLRRGDRAPGERWRAVVLGLVMGGTLIAVVVVQPAIGSTTAGLAGLAAAWWLLPRKGGPRPALAPLVTAAAPYVALTVFAVIGFALPPVRAVLERIPPIAPTLPGVDAAFGFTTAAAPVTPVFRPLLHPLPYLLIALLVAVVVYRRQGWWPPGTGAAAMRGWGRRCRSVSASILGLVTLAAVMTDAGMIAAIAQALADTLGLAFVAVSAPLGAFGTVLTGSTTASNALFSALQAEVAGTLGIAVAVLVAGQTAGGNLGNAVSPAVGPGGPPGPPGPRPGG